MSICFYLQITLHIFNKNCILLKENNGDFDDKLWKILKIIRSIAALNQVITDNKARRFLIGFVPTMGSIHKGHISLVQKSILENDYTICSIYVNPTQFNDKTDFIKLKLNELLENIMIQKVDDIFMPN